MQSLLQEDVVTVTSITPSERASLIKGLRTLADYLDTAAHAPHCAEVMFLPVAVRGGRGYAVVCVDSEVAILTGAKGSTAEPRNFGPVTYKITLAPRISSGDEAGE